MTITLDWWSHIWIILHLSSIYEHIHIKNIILGDGVDALIHEKMTKYSILNFTIRNMLFFTCKYRVAWNRTSLGAWWRIRITMSHNKCRTICMMFASRGTRWSYNQTFAHPSGEHFMHLRCDNVAEMLQSSYCLFVEANGNVWFMLCGMVLYTGRWTATIHVSTIWTILGDCHMSHIPPTILMLSSSDQLPKLRNLTNLINCVEYMKEFRIICDTGPFHEFQCIFVSRFLLHDSLPQALEIVTYITLWFLCLSWKM